MQRFTDHQVETLPKLITKIQQCGKFCLLDLICFNVVLCKKYPPIKISPKNLRVYAIVTKSAQRCARVIFLAYIEQHVDVVGVKPDFQHLTNNFWSE